MRFVVDPALCCGHGLCADVAPEVYALDDDGFNVEAGGDAPVPPGQESEAEEGARSCPDGAIQILS